MITSAAVYITVEGTVNKKSHAMKKQCHDCGERLSSPRSMLHYVILLNIHKRIGYKFGVACCCTLTSTTDFRFLGKAPSQLFYSSFQGIQYTFTSVPMHQNS